MGLCRRSMGYILLSMDVSLVQMSPQSSPGSEKTGQIQGSQSKNPTGKQNTADLPSDLRWGHTFLISTSAEGCLSYGEEEISSFHKGWSLTKRIHPLLINTVFLQNGERKNATIRSLWPRKNYENKLPTRI